MSTDAPPNNLPAERYVLGAMLQSDKIIDKARGQLKADDFYSPNHGLLFTAIGQVHDLGIEADNGISVVQHLTAQNLISKFNPADIFGLYQAVMAPGNWPYYAQPIRRAARLRRILQHTQRIAQMVNASPIGEDGHDDQLQRIAAEELQLAIALDESDHDGPVKGLYTWDEFLNRPEMPDEWIIPDLVARQDVVMLLGGEGAGKSWISRQFAQCLPAGVHPWRTHVRIPPMRTLLVDLEVSESTLLRETRPMSHQVQRLGDWNGTEGWVWHHPEGLDIRTRSDAQLFERVVADTSPDIVLFGSLYNAFSAGRDNHEQVANDLREVFNRIRTRHRCALWLEHHMPKGDGQGNRPITPYGSSVLLRWITHGRALRAIPPKSGIDAYAFELVQIRQGDRGHRDFPAGVIRGGALPVTPIFDPAEIDLMKEAA